MSSANDLCTVLSVKLLPEVTATVSTSSSLQMGAAGSVLGGIGGLFGGLGIGRAAGGVARTTDRFAEHMATETTRIRMLLEERVIPALEGSLGKFNETLEHIDHFVDVATHSLNIHTNTIGMVVMILGAVLCRRLIRDIKASPLESLILYTIYYGCLSLVFFFGYELLIHLGILSSVGNYRLIVIVFGSAMFEMISQAIWYVIEHINKLFSMLLHCLSVIVDFLLVKPFVWFATPVTRGKKYFGSVCGLAFLVYMVVLLAYYIEVVVELYLFAMATWREYSGRLQAAQSGPTWGMKFKIALILYVACTAASLLTHALFSCIISHVFRPYWRFKQLQQLNNGH